MRPTLRVAAWNVEWFNALFDDRGAMLDDDAPSARHGITRGAQLAALRRIFAAIDADAVLVVEAPDTGGRRSSARALERFAAGAGLRARRAVTGFPSGTEQELTLLHDPDRLGVRHDPQDGGEAAPRFDGSFGAVVAEGSPPEPVRFARPPLELALTTAGGMALRLIGVHVKSKAPHGAQDAAGVARVALLNRRKQLRECLWIRARVEAHLAAGDPLVVLGDFNDGPGLDAYEAEFGRSGVEVVLGEPPAALHDPHAAMALAQRVGIVPTTARFWLGGRWFEALLDFIMVSPDLAARSPAWRIWHPFNDPACYGDPVLREALLAASDHFPVTLDLPL